MNILSTAKDVLESEAKALELLSKMLDHSIVEAVHLITRSSGRLIVSGIGKSGHVGQKIASTLSSTGTPSFFVHPSEASHGDLGMIQPADIVLVISRSGESSELFDLLEYCLRRKIPIIGITSNLESSMAKASSVTLKLPDVPEACPMQLAPTSSTTMSLALGDALAIACLQVRKFTSTDFGDIHPGGKLGKRLRRVSDVMHHGADLPLVDSGAKVSDALIEMTRCAFGCVGVVDSSGILIGIFTDGDLRRKLSPNMLDQSISEFMTRSPLTLSPDRLASDVVALFAEKRIPSCFITIDGMPVGIIHIHHLTRSGIV
jgi:arabinose-5-phosphate isomerase